MAELQTPWHVMSVDAWIDLAGMCGLPIDKATHTTLIEHDMLRLIDGAMSPLQLLALDRYLKIVSKPRHSWSEPEPTQSDLVSYLNWYEQAHQHIEQLCQKRPGQRPAASMDWLSDVLSQWFVEHDIFPAPLDALVHSLNPQVVEQWTGQPRLWTLLSACHRAMTRDDATVTTRTTVRTPRADPLGLRQTAEIESPFQGTKAAPVGRQTLALESLSRDDIPPASLEEPSSDVEDGIAPIRVTTEMDAVSLQTERFADRQAATTGKAPSLPQALKEDQKEKAPSKPSPTLELKQRLSQLRQDAPTPSVVAASPAPSPTPSEEAADAPTSVIEETPDVQPEAQPVTVLDVQEPTIDEPAETAQAVDGLSDVSEISAVSDVSEASEPEDVSTPEEEKPKPPSLPVVQKAPEVVDDTPDEAPASASVDMGTEDEVSSDEEEATTSNDAPPEVEEPPVADEAPSKEQLTAQIKTLNQKREQYMRAQNWEGLVALYEDGIMLFGEKDRPQIYTTLSKLYEVKLKNPERAFDNMKLAFEHAALPSSARDQYEQHIHRLGQHAQVHETYRGWLSESLSRTSNAATLIELTKKRSRLDQSAGNVRQGFLEFASLLSETPTIAVHPGALDVLDDLGEGLPFDELDAIFDDLYQQAQDDDQRSTIAQHAGLSALERDVNHRAIHYLWLACAINPTNDAAFHGLASVCEEERAWHQLVSLYALRLTHEPDHTVLKERYKDYHKRMLDEPNGALDHYQAKLDQSADDVESLDRLIEIYLHQQRHGELYGLLNRHLDQVSGLSARVHTLHALANIAVGHLYAPEEAAVHYQQVLDLSTGQQEMIEQLISSCVRNELWSVAVDAIDALTTDKDVSLSVSAKVAWLMKGTHAATSSNRLRDRRRFLENILALEPSHKEAMQLLQE